MAHQLSIQMPSGRRTTLSNQRFGRPLSCLDMLSGPSVNNLTKSLGHETRAILTYTARSTFNGTILSHLRQPVIACTPPPAERKDRNDDKPFPPRYLTTACRTVMALPLPQRHHNKPKSLPTIKGDRASDTIKGASMRGEKVSFLTQ